MAPWPSSSSGGQRSTGLVSLTLVLLLPAAALTAAQAATRLAAGRVGGDSEQLAEGPRRRLTADGRTGAQWHCHTNGSSCPDTHAYRAPGFRSAHGRGGGGGHRPHKPPKPYAAPPDETRQTPPCRAVPRCGWPRRGPRLPLPFTLYRQTTLWLPNTALGNFVTGDVRLEDGGELGMPTRGRVMVYVGHSPRVW